MLWELRAMVSLRDQKKSPGLSQGLDGNVDGWTFG
jgi:hypothetical protein